MSSLKRGRNALINQGFDVINIDVTTQRIPDSLTALVLADPSVPLNNLQQQKIQNYLDNGGNMLITGEPNRQPILNPLLNTIGVNMKNGMLVNPSKDDSPDLIFGNLNGVNGRIAMQSSADCPGCQEAISKLIL